MPKIKTDSSAIALDADRPPWSGVAPPRAYSIPEAASIADAGRTTIYRAISAGELVARKRGRRTVILSDDLAAWLRGLKPATVTMRAA